jgi:hypothetical protein
MPHYKCAACKARIHVSGRAAELLGDLCPECGSLLEPVSELAELIGFRSIKSVGAARAASPQRVADLLDGFLTRRAAILDRDRVDAERWLGDDDAPLATAVELPPPQACP